MRSLCGGRMIWAGWEATVQEERRRAAEPADEQRGNRIRIAPLLAAEGLFEDEVGAPVVGVIVLALTVE